MAQLTAPWDRPLLTVRDRQLPVLRARGGHGRRGPIALQHGGDGHKLILEVRPVHVDHLPRWQGAAGARQLCELVRVRGLGRAAATCGARGSVSWTDEGPAMTVVVRCGLLPMTRMWPYGHHCRKATPRGTVRVLGAESRPDPQGWRQWVTGGPSRGQALYRSRPGEDRPGR
jgi:hypothetical protein